MKHDTFALLVAHYCQAVIYRTPEVGRIEREVIATYDRLNDENERLRRERDAAITERDRNRSLLTTAHEAWKEEEAAAALLRAENERLRAALEAVEYADMESRCPWCGNWYNKGHAPNCQRQAALGR